MNVSTYTTEFGTKITVEGATDVAVIVEDERTERIYLPPPDDIDPSYYQSDATTLRIDEEANICQVVHPRPAKKVRVFS